MGEAITNESKLALLDVCRKTLISAGKCMGQSNSPCLIGLNGSSLEISIFAFVHLGTSTTTALVNSDINPDRLTYCS